MCVEIICRETALHGEFLVLLIIINVATVIKCGKRRETGGQSGVLLLLFFACASGIINAKANNGKMRRSTGIL